MPSKSQLSHPERVIRCKKCGHLESEHGLTGTRPCLAMVGDLLNREFCSCDQLQLAIATAA